MTVEIDVNPSVQAKDFTTKLTKDMTELLRRNLDIMQMELKIHDSINVMLSVLALVGIATARGACAPKGTFGRYVELAEDVEDENAVKLTMPTVDK